MGFVRGVLVVLVSVLLFLSLIIMNLCLTLSLSLEYNNVEKNALIAVKSILPSQENVSNYATSMIPEIQQYCQNQTSYVFSYEGETIEIPCEIGIQGQDAIIEQVARDMIYEAYYTEYNCEFFDCFDQSETPFFLISSKAQQYWSSQFYFLILVSFILAIALFFLTKKKTNAFIIIGSLMLTSALPFLKLDSFIHLFSDNLVFQFVRIFFAESYYAALNTLCLGIIILILGIVFKIFKLGFKISEWLSKFDGRATKTPKSK